jgi:hypothetical protein
MIVESPAALKLMAALADLGAAGATRHYLMSKADISTSSFYRIIGPLIENGLVHILGTTYVMAFNSPYCFRFKLWRDMERLYDLPPGDRDTVLSIASVIQSQFAPGIIRALWLVGSGARGELTSESDLDFLLITHGKRSPIAIGPHRRQVSVIQMSDQEFREAVGKADGFVVSALRSGIVLLDYEFVQPFYLSPPSVKITPQQVRAEETTLDRHREKILIEIESDDIELARNSIRSQAMHVGRLLLRAFGELPENRNQLIEVSRQYFGESWARTLSDAILDQKVSKAEMIRLSRQISEQHDSFQSQFEHLESFAPLATAGGLILESLCARAFEELLPNAKIERRSGKDDGIDLRIVGPNAVEYLIEIKSSREHIPESSIERAVDVLERARRSVGGSAHLIIVANSWVGKPPFEPVVDLYRGRASSHASQSRSANLSVLSGLQVLCAHNRLHLEEFTPSEVLHDLLSAGRRVPGRNQRKRDRSL